MSANSSRSRWQIVTRLYPRSDTLPLFDLRGLACSTNMLMPRSARWNSWKRPSTPSILDLRRKYTVYHLADVRKPWCQWRSRFVGAGDAKRMKKSRNTASRRHAPENRLPTQKLSQLHVQEPILEQGVTSRKKARASSWELLQYSYASSDADHTKCTLHGPAVSPWPSWRDHAGAYDRYSSLQIQYFCKLSSSWQERMYVHTPWQWSGQLWHNSIIIRGSAWLLRIELLAHKCCTELSTWLMVYSWACVHACVFG